MKSPKFHYFDYNATHPPLKDILKNVLETYVDEFSNPSGSTRFSLKNQGRIEEARKFFSTNDGYILDGHIFSSTGTEANYYLIAGLRKKYPNLDSLYTSGVEHSSMYAAISHFGFQPILISTLKDGKLDLDDLEKKLSSNPLPISVIYAANETGVIQPMESIKNLAQSYNVPVVSDCMQAFGKIPIVYSLIDAYTCSGHKIGAGMGSALTAFNEELLPKSFDFIQGGNQENGYRAGTENLYGIMSFHQVAKHQLNNLELNYSKNRNIQIRIQEALLSLDCEIIGLNSLRLPNTHFTILPIEDLDFFMMGMEERNIQISTGSSCKSRAREASPSLLRMGYTEEEALRAVRISWGCLTSIDDVDSLIESFKEVLKSL